MPKMVIEIEYEDGKDFPTTSLPHVKSVTINGQPISMDRESEIFLPYWMGGMKDPAFDVCWPLALFRDDKVLLLIEREA